jgi:hypothetical protein
VSAIILLGLRILLAGLLYGFLGLAIYTLLRDLKQQGELLAGRQPPPLTLTSLMEANVQSQYYTKPEIILGREPGCDFPLDDQTEAVTAPVVITHGDELRLGHLGVKVEFGQADHKPSG